MMPISRSFCTLCCVGLVFSSPAAGIHGTSVRCRKAQLPRAHLQAHLAHRLEERQRLDVADRAADLDDRDVDLVPSAGAAPDELLDLVGDVRDHLHGLAEVVAAALLLEHALVDLAGGEVVASASSCVVMKRS